MKLFDLFTKDMTPDWDVFEKAFPEMATCEHSKRWHKEGSPLNHTKLVTKEMFNIINSNFKDKDPEWKLIMLSAAMLHDIGKPSTTYWNEAEQDWSCKSHGNAGELLFRNVFKEERMDLREKVAYMIRYHMLLHHTMQKSTERKERELIQLINGTVPIEDMLLLNECDMRGSISEENNNENVLKHIQSVNEAIEDVRARGIDNQWKYVSDRTARMYVMIGVAGSGKSTYAKHIQENCKAKGVFELPIISRDTVRIEMGLCSDGEKCIGNKKEENKVSQILEDKIKGYSEMGMSFIVDNTSLKKKYRDQYIDYISKYNVAPIFVYVEAPTLQDNINRRYGQIDAEIIQNMWDTMQFPNKSGCYELWLVDENNESTFII